MKYFKKILLLMIPLVLLCGCTKEEVEETPTDAVKFKEEYEALNDVTREKDGKTIRSITISEDNPFVYKSADDIINMMDNKESFIVYFGFADCPWCRSMLPTLVEVADDLDVDVIYYVDVKDIRDVLTLDTDDKTVITSQEGSDGYYKLINYLEDVLNDYTLTNSKGKEISSGEKRIYAPNIVAVVDGKPEKMTMGISEKQTDGYMDITEEMHEDMYNELKCLIECVLNNNSFCSPEGC